MAVPAQRAAGVSKSYTGETVYEKDDTIDTPQEPDKEPADKTKELQLRARLGEKKKKNNTIHN